jgi:hypothetical protein
LLAVARKEPPPRACVNGNAAKFASALAVARNKGLPTLFRAFHIVVIKFDQVHVSVRRSRKTRNNKRPGAFPDPSGGPEPALSSSASRFIGVGGSPGLDGLAPFQSGAVFYAA